MKSRETKGNHRKSKEIEGHQKEIKRKSKEIEGNPIQSQEIEGNRRKSMEKKGNQRFPVFTRLGKKGHNSAWSTPPDLIFVSFESQEPHELNEVGVGS